MFSVNDVAEQLINQISSEWNGNTARYFLHISEHGEILPGQSGAEETFSVDVDVSEYANMDLDDPREEFESLDNQRFRDVCENLRSQAKEYIEAWGLEEPPDEARQMTAESETHNKNRKHKHKR